MKKWTAFLICIAIAAVATGAAVTLNYMESGSRWVVGGSLDVVSGGDLDIESGGSLKIAGTAVTATAAQLNAAGGGALTDLDLGASGTAGSLDIFPTTASKGKTRFTMVDNTGNTTNTITNAAQSATATWTHPDTNGNADYVMTAAAQTIGGVKTFSSPPVASGASITAGTIPRASMAEDVLQVYPLLFPWWVDTGYLPLTTPAVSGKFGLGAVGTGVTGFTSVEVDNTSETPTMTTSFVLPPEYVAAGDVRVIVTAKVTTGPASVKTVDIQAYEASTLLGTLGADICATAAQSVTTSFAEYSFTITATGIVAGDTIQIALDGSITDDAAGATTTLQITGIKVVCDVKA